jgi:hypothetical protein
MLKHSILYGFVVVMIIACSKSGTVADEGGTGGGGGGGGHETGAIDSVAPVVEIYSPIPNQAYQSGSNIAISGRVTDNLGLFRGSIRITNDANGAVLKEQLYEIHFILSYNFELNYLPAVSTVTDCTMTVSFEDHGSNITTRTTRFRVNP